jgi:hypothetical protein
MGKNFGSGNELTGCMKSGNFLLVEKVSLCQYGAAP